MQTHMRMLVGQDTVLPESHTAVLMVAAYYQLAIGPKTIMISFYMSTFNHSWQ